MAANRKLTEQYVQFIRLAREFLSARDLAVNFNVSVQTVNDVLAGRTWRQVELPSFPLRPLKEVLRDCKAQTRHALDALLNLQEDRRERGEPESQSLEETIILAKMCAGLYPVRGGGNKRG